MGTLKHCSLACALYHATPPQCCSRQRATKRNFYYVLFIMFALTVITINTTATTAMRLRAERTLVLNIICVSYVERECVLRITAT